MSSIWFLMVISTLLIVLFALGYIFYSVFVDIYDYVCDELDHCKYFGD